LFVFTSDNGGFAGVSDNRPLRAAKGYLYEGGIRVPLIVRWPGVVQPATTCDVPVISMDFYPTLLEAAGVPRVATEAPDGESLMPLLKRTGPLPRDALFFHYPNYAWHGSNRLGSAMRSGPYKLIEYFDDDSVELFNLMDDLSETHNLAGEMPELATKLRSRLAAWRQETGAAMPVPKQPPAQ
jgi:arylsulfatase A